MLLKYTGTDPRKQIGCIFEILGTPDEVSWPGIKTDLECNEIDIPPSEGRGLVSMAPKQLAEANTLNLLERLLKCNPKRRISSAEALCHKYFSPLPKQIYDLHDSVSIFSLVQVKLSPEPHAARSKSRQSLHSYDGDL